MASKRLLLLLFLSVIFSFRISAQQTATVYGKVYDPEGKPLYGAVITSSDKKIVSGTDGDGKFNLQIPANENVQLIIFFTGLKPDTFNIRLTSGDRKEITSRMTGKVYQMSEFVI